MGKSTVARGWPSDFLLAGKSIVERRREMKVEATVVFKFQTSSLSEAGSVLDDVLGRAHERDDVDVGQITVTTPPGATQVSLPAVSTPGGYPPGVPQPGNRDGG
jgi:hypothetical protein